MYDDEVTIGSMWNLILSVIFHRGFRRSQLNVSASASPIFYKASVNPENCSISATSPSKILQCDSPRGEGVRTRDYSAEMAQYFVHH
jgi:hypothetical protein